MKIRVPGAAEVVLPLLLLFACYDLLLRQGHLLLHVGDLLLGSASVLLKQGPKREQKHKRELYRDGHEYSSATIDDENDDRLGL